MNKAMSEKGNKQNYSFFNRRVLFNQYTTTL